jgi:hypothetical protein
MEKIAIDIVWPGSRKEKRLRTADRARTMRERLAPLNQDLKWLRNRIGAASDPVVQEFIRQTQNKIAATKRRGRS